MKFGYIRVSTEGQNTIRQDILMKNLNVDYVFTDKASGKSTKERPELARMMELVHEGDTVVVESISRFARSVRDLLDLTAELEEKGVQFVSQKEMIDTSTPQGRFMMTVWGAMAEMEREQILQRQREGIEAAKAQGKYKGRKPIEIDLEVMDRIHTRWYKGEITSAYAMKKLGVSRATFYKKMWEYEDGHGIPRKNNKKEAE